jgi:osmotically-inducible protein OsmY
MTRSTTLAVDVQTVDGVVRLLGEVPEDVDVQRAIAATRRVSGVRDVDATRLTARVDQRH